METCNVHPEEILAHVADAAGLTVEEVLLHTRRRYATDCLAVAAFLMRREGYSLTHIGAALRRHHATVLFALRKVDCALRVRRGYEGLIRLLERAGGDVFINN